MSFIELTFRFRRTVKRRLHLPVGLSLLLVLTNPIVFELRHMDALPVGFQSGAQFCRRRKVLHNFMFRPVLQLPHLVRVAVFVSPENWRAASLDEGIVDHDNRGTDWECGMDATEEGTDSLNGDVRPPESVESGSESWCGADWSVSVCLKECDATRPVVFLPRDVQNLCVDVCGDDASCRSGKKLRPVPRATRHFQNVLPSKGGAQYLCQFLEVSLPLRLVIHPLVFGCSPSIIFSHHLVCCFHHLPCRTPGVCREVPSAGAESRTTPFPGYLGTHCTVSLALRIPSALLARAVKPLGEAAFLLEGGRLCLNLTIQ